MDQRTTFVPWLGIFAPFAGLAATLNRAFGFPLQRLEASIPDPRLANAVSSGLFWLTMTVIVALGIRDTLRWREIRRAAGPRPKVNQKGREVWFEPYGMGFNPVHCKGWTLVVVTLFIQLVIAIFFADAGKNLQEPWSALFIASLLSPIGWLFWMTRRHMSPEE